MRAATRCTNAVIAGAQCDSGRRNPEPRRQELRKRRFMALAGALISDEVDLSGTRFRASTAARPLVVSM